MVEKAVVRTELGDLERRIAEMGDYL